MVQTTTDVEQERAFEFWSHTVLGRSGDATAEVDEQRSFTARRFVAVTAQSTLLHTRSDKISVERLPHHIRRDDRDDVTIVLLLHGGGFHEQGNRGALLSPGDIGFAIGNRPYFAGTHGEYEEIRLVTSRTAFRTHIGEPEAFAGGKIGRSALSELFASYLRGYAGSVARMSETEAGIAVEAALHLLRGLAGVPSSEVSTDALRSLALAHIERRLHDPSFGTEALHQALCVSRSRLYSAFTDGEGVAAVIRNARLDRAHKHLSSPANDGRSIEAIMYSCGFTDAPSFSRAFRQRFGLSPRDLRNGRGQTP